MCVGGCGLLSYFRGSHPTRNEPQQRRSNAPVMPEEDVNASTRPNGIASKGQEREHDPFPSLHIPPTSTSPIVPG